MASVKENFRNVRTYTYYTNNQNLPPRRSLLDIYVAAERERTNKRIDFAGRLCTPIGQVAKLYPNLGQKDANARVEGDTK